MFGPLRKIGNNAENLALQYLKKNSLKLIKQNFNSKFGEIDLIMLDNNVLVFIEVRYRTQNKFGLSVETVDIFKQQKIIKTAQLFLQKYKKYHDFICRFDVIGVESSLKYPQFNWIKDAFIL